MIVVERTMLVKQEHADQFSQIFTSDCPLEDVPGFIRRSVFRKRLDDGTEQFLIYVMFKDQASLELWSGSEAQQASRKRHADLFAYLIHETKGKVQLVKELFPK